METQIIETGFVYNVTDIEANRTYKATFDNQPTDMQLEELRDWYVDELGTVIENIKIEKA